ncbi:hypothetical protein SAMN06297129_1449 [Pseudooceanicola antarcticus]|uniref:Uncharacterized protein n=1 Tax=Pseudooceanicola antarcticus TaxID=1247613 RepID=A0A285IKE2_9RHOB|nr:hypothetical protein [Pseudooceanicola antarcticus]SNY48439.1 hypothetical protein SAMN06297129_1449 [Pseudooceanicola antarcticus]
MTTTTPKTEDLRRAQAALDALNAAYEYFTPLPRLVSETRETQQDYAPYTAAA